MATATELEIQIHGDADAGDIQSWFQINPKDGALLRITTMVATPPEGEYGNWLPPTLPAPLKGFVRQRTDMHLVNSVNGLVRFTTTDREPIVTLC